MADDIIYPKYIPNEKELAKSINVRTYVNLVDRLQLMATSIFTWDGLDDVAGFGASRFLEQVLFVYGRACFVKDPSLGYMALKVNPCAKYNVYRMPTEVEAFSYEYNKKYKLNDIVYIMNNEMEMPTIDTALYYAWRIYETERTIDVNVNAQKTPIILETDAKSFLTLKNVYMQYSGNMPVIFGRKNFNLNDKINAVSTTAPYVVDKLDEHKDDLLQEYMKILGIDYANIEKKERLIKDEVKSAETSTNYNLNMWYKTRKEAADLINEKFFSGEEKVSVQLNKELQDLLAYSESSQADLDNGISGTINSDYYKDKEEDN